MSEPLAYFLTWTTYGTWLHGDERGWVNVHIARCVDDYGIRSDGLVAYSRHVMKWPEMRLSPEQRSCVEAAVRSVCEYRSWELKEINCRSNHVHVVVRAVGIASQSLMKQFKAYATRALRQHWVELQQDIWTRDGSTRYLNSEESLAAAIEYVRNQ